MKRIIKEKFLSIYRNFITNVQRNWSNNKKKFLKLLIEFCDVFAENSEKVGK